MPIRAGSSASKSIAARTAAPARRANSDAVAAARVTPVAAARRGRSAQPELSAAAVKPKGLIHAIVLSWGWRRWLIAFAAGALSALAMAPFNVWPVLFLTFPTLVWLIDGAGVGRWRGVNGRGGHRLVVRLRLFSRRPLLDRLCLSRRCADLRLAVADRGDRPAGGARDLHRVRRRAGAAAVDPRRVRILALGVALTAAEWLRGHVLTGFPWNAFGYALTSPLALAQSASVIGIWGLTFIAVVVFASPATLDRRSRRNPLAVAAARARLAVLLADRRLRRAAPRPHADAVCRRRASAHHAAEPAAGRAVQLRRQAGGDGPLHRAVRSRLRTAIARRARRHAL